MTSRQVELITIGDELLLGFTVDTNAAHISRVLAAEGIDVARRTTIGDSASVIAGAVSEALSRTGSVITTGGLGPTSDDLTRPAIAELFGRKLRLDEAMLADLEARWRSRFPDGRFPASNRTQAEVPDGAKILVNRHGTAPGLWLEDDAGRWVAMLPGVPREMRGILREELLPLLEKRLGSGKTVVLSRTLRTTGIAESAISELLGARFFADSGLGEIPLAYLPGVAGVDLRVTMKGMPRSAAKPLLDAAIVKLRSRVEAYAYGEDETDMAEIVLEQCRQRGFRLSVAESCTGGMLGERLTSIPGASDVFLGGIIAYDNQVKLDALGVSAAALEQFGAVSERIAIEMARGALNACRADVALSITGIAGPDGGTPEKPVGLIWVGIAGPETAARRFHVGGDRAEIRQRGTQAALEMLRRALNNR